MTNGDNSSVASPAPSASGNVKPTSAEIKARTIAVLNVPDTVNDARIHALAEPYGPLVKIVLRPDHQGAILEFKDVADAGKAALGIDGYEILPGRFLRVGSVEDMRTQKAEKKIDKIGGKIDKKETPLTLQSNMAIRRPGQARGRRGGLGVKRGGAASASAASAAKTQDTNKRMEGTGTNGTSNAQDGGRKSNADFKAMISGQKEHA